MGGQLTATVETGGGLQAWLAPGAAIPLVFEQVAVWFTAGSTTYEFDIFCPASPFEVVAPARDSGGSVTIGRVNLTPTRNCSSSPCARTCCAGATGGRQRAQVRNCSGKPTAKAKRQ